MVRTSALFAFYPDREIYQSRYGQNLQFLLPLTYRKKCGFIDEPQMNYNIQENSLSQTTDHKMEMKRLLENGAGYRDIRIHLIKQVVDDPEELQKYMRMADVAYYRLVLNKAVDLKDKEATKKVYADLKSMHEITIDDRINCWSVTYPCAALPLRCIRKLMSILKI